VCGSVASGPRAAIDTYPVRATRSSPGLPPWRFLSAGPSGHPQLTFLVSLRRFKRITLPTHATLYGTRHHLFGTLAVSTIGRWENQPPFGCPAPLIAERRGTSPLVRTSGSTSLQARHHPDCMNLPMAEAQPIGRKTSTRTRPQATAVDEPRQAEARLANSRMIIPACTHIGASGRVPL